MTRTMDRYLFAIRMLKEKYLCVRAVDVAHYLGFSKASVSSAMRQMRAQGLIEVEPDGNLNFTEAGRERSEFLLDRVCFFERLLREAGVEAAQAQQDAISFSWEMSEDAFEAFKAMKTG